MPFEGMHDSELSSDMIPCLERQVKGGCRYFVPPRCAVP
ncbi:hypothetical protein DA2_3853 [Desulfovibrio sp. A2]|nr:hypothetical protein DA2_3853 [Desulfovibrio sp. A2]